MRSLIVVLFLATALSQRLTADIYFESLCPGCQEFIKTSLATALQTPDIEKIVHIRLIPYGNTRRKQDASGQWVFTCQHGAVECYGDVIELCAQNRVAKAFPDQELPLAGIINCIEKDLTSPYSNLKFDAAIKNCASQYKYDANDVISCASNQEGVLLHVIAADETDALVPAHQWVPWAVANRNFTEATGDEILNDLVGWACNNYQGEVTIAACKNRQINTQI